MAKEKLQSPIDVANAKSLEEFVRDYLPDGDQWKTWTHPHTQTVHHITPQTASSLSTDDLEACFRLIELTSSDDYKKSKDGWNPRSKRKEMKLLDLKYMLVKDEKTGKIEGFMSFMPTYEDDYPVIYCYEIHLSSALQGSGLGTTLIGHLSSIAAKIPSTAKVMLTVFTRNQRGVNFYTKLGFTKDEYSPPPKILRNGTKVEAEYVILSKAMPQ